MEDVIFSILNCHKLSGFIDGSISPPSKYLSSQENTFTPTMNPEYDSQFLKDQTLLAWILSSLNKEVFPYIIRLTSSFEVWKALAHAFGSISQNRQLQSNIELQELKHNDISVSQYLQKSKALVDELAIAERQLSISEFNAIIYRNIGSEFHPIITALNLHLEPASFHGLYGHLLAHEILLKSTQETPLANIAYQQSTFDSTSQSSFD